jgi:hypothetical protein
LVRTFLSDYLALVEPEFRHLLELGAADLVEPPSSWEPDECAAGVIALVPVRGRSGTAITILVLVEQEPGSLSDAQLSRCFFSLLAQHQRPALVTLLRLRDGRAGVNLETSIISKALGTEILRLSYTSFGLANSRADFYLQRPEPLSWALAAAMKSPRLSAPELRQACLDRIAAADLPSEQKELLGSFVHLHLDRLCTS